MQFRYSGVFQFSLEVQPFDFVLVTLTALFVVAVAPIIQIKVRGWWKGSKDYKTIHSVGTPRSVSSSPSASRGQAVAPVRGSAAVSRRSPSHSDRSFASHGRSAQDSRPKAKAKARASRRPAGQTPTQPRQPQEPVPEPEIQPLVREREEVPSTPRGPLGGLELDGGDNTGASTGENRVYLGEPIWGYCDTDLIQHLEGLSDQLQSNLAQGPEYRQPIYEHTE